MEGPQRPIAIGAAALRNPRRTVTAQIIATYCFAACDPNVIPNLGATVGAQIAVEPCETPTLYSAGPSRHARLRLKVEGSCWCTSGTRALSTRMFLFRYPSVSLVTTVMALVIRSQFRSVHERVATPAVAASTVYRAPNKQVSFIPIVYFSSDRSSSYCAVKSTMMRDW